MSLGFPDAGEGCRLRVRLLQIFRQFHQPSLVDLPEGVMDAHLARFDFGRQLKPAEVLFKGFTVVDRIERVGIDLREHRGRFTG